jgi:hypothetical protein
LERSTSHVRLPFAGSVYGMTLWRGSS